MALNRWSSNDRLPPDGIGSLPKSVYFFPRRSEGGTVPARQLRRPQWQISAPWQSLRARGLVIVANRFATVHGAEGLPDVQRDRIADEVDPAVSHDHVDAAVVPAPRRDANRIAAARCRGRGA